MTVDEAKDALALSKVVQDQADELWHPPVELERPHHEKVLPGSVFANTRSYIEKIVFQINGCYEAGCYDACSVMIRRLLETLIIEAFEHHKVVSQIQDSNGAFLRLSGLIDQSLQCKRWNLTRNCKSHIRKLKAIGDLSAHSRYYLAQRNDIDKHADGVRIVAQELLFLAHLK